MNIEEITPQDAIAAVENGSVFIDVRESYELEEVSYGINHLHIPMGEIADRTEELPKDKTLIIGCRSGKRSMSVCTFLAMNGFENIKNLQGGILGWVDNGCPTK